MLQFTGMAVRARTSAARNSGNNNPYALIRVNMGTRQNAKYRDALCFASTFVRPGETDEEAHARGMAQATSFFQATQEFSNLLIRFPVNQVRERTYTTGDGPNKVTRTEEQLYTNINAVRAYNLVTRTFTSVAEAVHARRELNAAVPAEATVPAAQPEVEAQPEIEAQPETSPPWTRAQAEQPTAPTDADIQASLESLFD